ncbi:hypothetical protein OJ253_818 [Cryptosporidium canis]|uniref:Uncharacterized protein n=1 Tax=Cryptosporidium canis TaxID=195482 RepID=A0A9D5DKC7_9CRYT|nr:hypothetical protein OJ253_818 [Cryptosporidium canis]
MRRSESSSVLQRYNGRRKSSISGGRTASASMIGSLTPKSLSTKDSSKKEKSTWSRIFSPLSFGFEGRELSNSREESSYSLSRRRTHDYSRVCPSFQRKGSLRPSPNTQVRDRNTLVSESAEQSYRPLASAGLGLDDDALGLHDLSSSVFEPVLGQMSRSNNIVSRVQAFSGKDAAGHIQRSRTAGFAREDSKTSIYSDLRILRFHDGISGKTFKASRDGAAQSERAGKGSRPGMGLGKAAKSHPNDAPETSFVEVTSNIKPSHFNRDSLGANRNTCVAASRSDREFVQGDVPYCDSILYLDDPKPRRDDTSFSKLHDRSLYKESLSSRFE